MTTSNVLEAARGSASPGRKHETVHSFRIGSGAPRPLATGTIVRVAGQLFRLVPCQPRPVKSRLSPREAEVARLVALGHPNKRIAITLGLSVHTVGTHLRRAYGKLGVKSRAAMVSVLGATGDGDPTDG